MRSLFRSAFAVWGVLVAPPALVVFFMAPAHGKIFYKTPLINTLSEGLQWSTYISAAIVILLYSRMKQRSISNKNLVISALVFISFTAFGPIVWRNLYLPLLGEYMSGTLTTAKGIIIDTREVKMPRGGRPALHINFQLHDDPSNYTAQFDSLLRIKSWQDLDLFKKWAPKAGDSVAFKIKENRLGRTIVAMQPDHLRESTVK